MISFILSAVKIIFLIGFLITIHELGHFTVAKLCNVKVNEFAIGFGPTIWKKQGKETQYALRLIPLGGFVNMEGEDERSEDSRSFSKASIPKRIAICIAGAAVNIIFALVVFFTLMAATDVYVSNEVDSTMDGYVAQTLGIQSGDKIIEIDGKKIKSKYDVDEIMKDNNGKLLKLKVERQNEIIEYDVKPTDVKYKSTGIYLDENCKVITLEKGSCAEKQGIKPNDVVLEINHIQLNGDVNKVREIINEPGNGTVLLKVKRDDQDIDIELTPDTLHAYYVGIIFKKADDTFINRCIYGGVETKDFVFSIIDNLKKLFTGNVGVDQMMGPVGISQVVAETRGWYEFIYMFSLISLSLGVTNFLPIPALDGGKILILIIEAIRRKPLKQETEINIQLIGFSILIALSLYVTYHDIIRIF